MNEEEKLKDYFISVLDRIKSMLVLFQQWADNREDGINTNDDNLSDPKEENSLNLKTPELKSLKRRKILPEHVEKRKLCVDQSWSAYTAMRTNWQTSHDVDALIALWTLFKNEMIKIIKELELLKDNDSHAETWIVTLRDFLTGVDHRLESFKSSISSNNASLINQTSDHEIPIPESSDVGDKATQTNSFLNTSMQDVETKQERKKDHKETESSFLNTPSLSTDKIIQDLPKDQKPQKIPDVAQASTINLMAHVAAKGKTQKPESITTLSLLHEISLNPNFTITLSPLEEQVTTVVHRAFFQDIAKLFQKGGKQALKAANSLLKDAKDRLLPLLPSTSSPSTITSIQNGLAPIDEYNEFRLTNILVNVISVMQSLCAPIRDESIRTLLSQVGSHISHGGLDAPGLALAFQKTLEMLDLMERDVVNWMIKVFRSQLVEEAKVAERLALSHSSNGIYQIPLTEKWIRKSRENLGEPRRNRRKEYIHAMTLSLFSNDPISRPDPNSINSLPEIFHLDAEILWIQQNRIQALVIIAALCTVAKSTAPLSNESVHRLWAILSAQGTNVQDLAVEMMSLVKKDAPNSDPNLVKRMVDKTLRASDPIWKLLLDRLGVYFETVAEYRLEGIEFDPERPLTNLVGFEQVFKETNIVMSDIHTILIWEWNVWKDVLESV